MNLPNVISDRLKFVETCVKIHDEPIKLTALQKEYFSTQAQTVYRLLGRRMWKTTDVFSFYLHHLIAHKGANVLHALPSGPQVTETSSMWRKYLSWQDWLRPLIKDDLKQTTTFRNPFSRGEWSKILFSIMPEPQKEKPGKKFGGAGLTMVVIDEAQDQNKDAIDFMIPGLLGQKVAPSIHFLGTLRWKKDWFFQTVTALSKKRPPARPTTLVQVKPTVELDKKGKVTRIYNPFIAQADIEFARTKMSREEFNANFCLIPRDKQGDVYNVFIQSSVFEKWTLHGGPCVAGVDIGRLASHTVVVFSEIQGKTLHVYRIHVFPLGTSMDDVISFLILERKSNPLFRYLVFDATGAGDMLLHMKAKELLAAGFILLGTKGHRGVVFSETWKDQIVEVTRDLFSRGLIGLCKDEEFVSEMQGYSYDDVHNKKMSYDRVDGFHLSVWGCCQVKPQGEGMIIKRIDADEENPILRTILDQLPGS